MVIGGYSLLRTIAPLAPPAPNLPLIPHLHLVETRRPLNWTNTEGRDCNPPPRVAAMASRGMIGRHRWQAGWVAGDRSQKRQLPLTWRGQMGGEELI